MHGFVFFNRKKLNVQIEVHKRKAEVEEVLINLVRQKHRSLFKKDQINQRQNKYYLLLEIQTLTLNLSRRKNNHKK